METESFISYQTIGLPKIYHKGRITFCSSFKNTFLKSNNYTIYLISFSQNEALCNSDLWRHVTVLYCSTGPNCIVATCTLFSKLTQYQWTYYFVIHLFYPIKAYNSYCPQLKCIRGMLPFCQERGYFGGFVSGRFFLRKPGNFFFFKFRCNQFLRYIKQGRFILSVSPRWGGGGGGVQVMGNIPWS